MNLNDVLTKQNLITKILLASDGKELSKELKVKIMRIRMNYNKIKKQFDEDISKNEQSEAQTFSLYNLT